MTEERVKEILNAIDDDRFLIKDRVYSKSTGKELTCTNLFQLKIKDVFPIRVQERLASALLHQVQFQRNSAVQVIVNKMQDLCSVSFEDSATIQSTSILLVLETLSIDHNKFIKREPIREGGFGLIYSAEWKERKEKVILKYVKSNPNIREFIEVRNFNKEHKFAQYADGAACESILNTTFRT
ncbi:hypothetical protein RhiirA4_538162 [Rhizophagus irregularis]|uniref:Protein kinase domain-containing protein n=1 Tax=Rhizophagus irregularis TaxID=588596 RepID=A0A2I1FYR8_9GLOM|nr:hypothetical protein RhiirA4_538162 [Rhizophagus irregularis]